MGVHTTMKEIKSTVKRFKYINGKRYDTETGELVSNKKLKEMSSEHIVDEFKKHQEFCESTGQECELNLVRNRGKQYTCRLIKKGHEYNKVFRVELRELFKVHNFSLQSQAFIGRFVHEISFPENSIVIGHQNPTYEEMAEMMGISKNIMTRTLNELEKVDVIRRKKKNGQNIVYFNPYLYCAGAYVVTETFELFFDSEYNPCHKLKYNNDVED